MDGAIDELKLKLKSDNGQQSVDLYNREKNMIVGKDPSNPIMTPMSAPIQACIAYYRYYVIKRR